MTQLDVRAVIGTRPTCPGRTSIDYEGMNDLDCQREPHSPDEPCQYIDGEQEVFWRFLVPGSYGRKEVEKAWELARTIQGTIDTSHS